MLLGHRKLEKTLALPHKRRNPDVIQGSSCRGH
jgi:hypothetical protein